MPLIEYKCEKCNDSWFVFDGEERKRPYQGGGNCGGFLRWGHSWRKMPPSPTIIHTTDTWMSEPHLDSFSTVYELDRILNIETRADKEMQMINDVRKNL